MTSNVTAVAGRDRPTLADELKAKLDAARAAAAPLNAEVVEIEEKLAKLQAAVAPMNEEIEVLSRALGDAKSREWIAFNGVTRSMVCDPNGKGMPYFNTVGEFAQWLLRKENRPPYAAWNDRIFPMEDILTRRLDWGKYPGRLGDIPGDVK